MAREQAAEERAKAKAARLAKTKWYEEPQFLLAVSIAYRRGIAVGDLCSAIGKPIATVLQHLKKLGYNFGKRPPLAEPLTLAQLLAFGDDSVPLPELRRDRLKRERLEREGKAKREKRERARAADAIYRARTEHYTARAAPRRADPARAEPPPGAGHPIVDRAKHDIRQKRMADNVKRDAMARAEAMVDAGARPTRDTNVYVKILMRAVEMKRAEDARLSCPVEALKTRLRRKGRVVYSMSVHGGAPDRYFCSGIGQDVTAEQLFAYAERISA